MSFAMFAAALVVGAQFWYIIIGEVLDLTEKPLPSSAVSIAPRCQRGDVTKVSRILSTIMDQDPPLSRT